MALVVSAAEMLDAIDARKVHPHPACLSCLLAVWISADPWDHQANVQHSDDVHMRDAVGSVHECLLLSAAQARERQDAKRKADRAAAAAARPKHARRTGLD